MAKQYHKLGKRETLDFSAPYSVDEDGFIHASSGYIAAYIRLDVKILVGGRVFNAADFLANALNNSAAEYEILRGGKITQEQRDISESELGAIMRSAK